MTEHLELGPPQKGMTLEECTDRANRFIGRNGICLLLLDVQNASQYYYTSTMHQFYENFQQLLAGLNTNFAEYMPPNDLLAYGQEYAGFRTVIGDSAGAGINSSEVIPDIMAYTNDILPCYFAVGEDGFDREATKLVK